MPTSFSEHARALLDLRRLSIAQLSEQAELAPSLVSKLLTDTASARREPRLEHVLDIARALQLAPAEVVGGTDAESLLAEWVPRAEFEAESKARTAAQAQAAGLRTDLAGARSEVEGLRAAIEQLTQSLAIVNQQRSESDTRAQREQALLRVVKESAEARCKAALAERDNALAVAEQNYRAWANACSHLELMRRQVAESKASAGLAAFLGTIGGALLGVAASEPPVPTSAVHQRSTKKRRPSA